MSVPVNHLVVIGPLVYSKKLRAEAASFFSSNELTVAFFSFMAMNITNRIINT